MENLKCPQCGFTVHLAWADGKYASYVCEKCGYIFKTKRL